jgi:hypothetical protein
LRAESAAGPSLRGRRIALNNGCAKANTPTAIGPDGRVHAMNNARLFSIGA